MTEEKGRNSLLREMWKRKAEERERGRKKRKEKEKGKGKRKGWSEMEKRKGKAKGKGKGKRKGKAKRGLNYRNGFQLTLALKINVEVISLLLSFLRSDVTKTLA